MENVETPKSFWGLIGVAVRDGEPILCEVEATPLGVLFRPVLTQHSPPDSPPGAQKFVLYARGHKLGSEAVTPPEPRNGLA